MLMVYFMSSTVYVIVCNLEISFTFICRYLSAGQIWGCAEAYTCTAVEYVITK